jgi:hypothetical protein
VFCQNLRAILNIHLIPLPYGQVFLYCKKWYLCYLLTQVWVWATTGDLTVFSPSWVPRKVQASSQVLATLRTVSESQKSPTGHSPAQVQVQPQPRGYIAFISFGGGGLNVHMLTCINLSLYQHKRHSQRQGVSFAFWVFNCFFCCCCLFCFVLQGEGVSTRVWTQGLLLVDRHSTT